MAKKAKAAKSAAASAQKPQATEQEQPITEEKATEATAAPIADAPVAAAAPSEDAKPQAEEQASATEEAAQPPADESTTETASSEAQPSADGTVVAAQPPADAPPEFDEELHPIKVFTPAKQEMELQVHPADTVMDLRQFLADALDTCFYTSYDLALLTPDGNKIPLINEYVELGEVANIAAGGYALQMSDGIYDERSSRNHLRRLRDLLYMDNVHVSVSTQITTAEPAEEPKAADAKDEPKKKAVPPIPELDDLSFLSESTSLLPAIAPALPPSVDVCIQSIAYSWWNPVPSYRRLAGDLLYLDAVTVEGDTVCITAHTRGYFVNGSTKSVFDPAPAENSCQSSTLVGLLRAASPGFSANFAKLLEHKAAGHPFESIAVPLPPKQWLERFPPPPHRPDESRAEDSLIAPHGADVSGIARDWNEEYQSIRELPKETLQDRIVRDRALYKVHCDFIEAAEKGAKAVIDRCLPPVNAADPERFHMYVYNGIFFSFAVDSSMPPPPPPPPHEATCALCAAKQAEAIAAGLDPPKTEVEPQSTLVAVVQGALEGEQATYASANNDLRGVRLLNKVDSAGLCTLAQAIVDYRGFRVIAQSIIPGILYGDKTAALQYGSVDNGKHIAWNEKFHEKVLSATKALHIAEHTVLDGEAKEVKLAAPLECKGIIGSDERYYVLDLFRMTPRDLNFEGEAHRYSTLRPELVESYCQKKLQGSEFTAVESAEASDAKKTAAGTDESAAEGAPAEQQMVLLNPNALSECKLGGPPEAIAADEVLVREASAHLKDTVLPKFVADLHSTDVSPLDGLMLSDAMHNTGINMRYLGHIAKQTADLPHIHDLCVTEMVVRTAKHELNSVLRSAEDSVLNAAISHFLNCLFGLAPTAPTSPMATSPTAPAEEVLSPSTKSKKKKKKAAAASSAEATEESMKEAPPATEVQHSHTELAPVNPLSGPAFELTASSLWQSITDGVQKRYQFELAEDARSRLPKTAALRSLCLAVGITVAARPYSFDAEKPFSPDDIRNLAPITKHTAPGSVDAHELLETGKAKLAQGGLQDAYELFSEAFSILQQVCGPLHKEVATCCRYLAMVHYQAGNWDEAIQFQQKELLINERILGLDHPETAHSYGNMALFYHGISKSKLALLHMRRAVQVLTLICQAEHPDCASTFINVAMMYQEVGNLNVALRYLQEALKRNERLLGKDHIQTAVCYHALAVAFNAMGAFKLSLQHERSCHSILKAKLGEEDPRTRDSLYLLKQFAMKDLQATFKKNQALLAAASKSGQLPTQAQAAAALRNLGIPGGLVGLRGAQAAGMAQGGRRKLDDRKASSARRKGESASGASSSNTPSTSGSQDLSSVEDLLQFINGNMSAAAGKLEPVLPPNNNKEPSAVDPTSPVEVSPKLANGSGSDHESNGAPQGLGMSLASPKKKAKPKKKAASKPVSP
eukprot:jgi/Chlat1/4530/Chrsp29S04454